MQEAQTIAGQTALELQAEQQPVNLEGRMTFKCLMCDKKVECSAEEDRWAWLKSEEVAAFKAQHAGCPRNAVGAELESSAAE